MSEEAPHERPEAEEHFGEAGLGEGQAEEPALDPEMLRDEDVSGDQGPADEELTDVPALEPAPVDPVADEQEEAAAAEAGAIGGRTLTDGLPEAERPLAEAGEGEAEGFELAEEQLIETASHGDAFGNPLTDRLPPENAESEDLTIYGEADHAEAQGEPDDSDENR